VITITKECVLNSSPPLPRDPMMPIQEYGFVTTNNPYNYVTVDNDFLELSVPGETPTTKKEKLELLETAGYFGYASVLDQ